MTTPNTSTADRVHRLIDMVVEEVSLVDRAANQHRFLIVKRDDSMDGEEESREATPGNATPGTPTEATPNDGATEKLAPDTPLGAAVAALESLTSIVELLSTVGAEKVDSRLPEFAQQLRETAERLLGDSKGSGESGSGSNAGAAPEPNDGASKSGEGGAATGGGAAPGGGALLGDFAANLTATKAALSSLAELVASVTPSGTGKREPTASPAQPAEPKPTLAESLAELAKSFRSLDAMVKSQQQRLGRVEKQFGLPNSAGPPEQVSKAAPEDEGWPLDLNNPQDRENVDKAVSFHDL